MVIKNQVFADQEMVLDGNSFIECTFTNCLLTYSAVLPVNMVSNRFNDCEWRFLGAAAATIDFMTALYNGGAEEVIESIFSNIRFAKNQKPG